MGDGERGRGGARGGAAVVRLFSCWRRGGRRGRRRSWGVGREAQVHIFTAGWSNWSRRNTRRDTGRGWRGGKGGVARITKGWRRRRTSNIFFEKGSSSLGHLGGLRGLGEGGSLLFIPRRARPRTRRRRARHTSGSRKCSCAESGPAGGVQQRGAPQLSAHDHFLRL